MSLRLIDATPRQGAQWVSRAFTLFLKRPFALTALFLAFLVAVVVVLALPYVGGLIVLAALPLLSLGFMIATRSALADGPVHAGQLLAPLLPSAPPAARRQMLILCGAYMLVTGALMLLSDQIDGGAFERLQILLASTRSEANTRDIDALLQDPNLFYGTLLRFGGSALLSVPFWHAPALVWWQGQSVGLALFSSTLACWRNKGAMLVYGICWVLTTGAFFGLAMALFALVGAPELVNLAAVPAVLMFSTAFYVSLYFTYIESFDVGAPEALPGG